MTELSKWEIAKEAYLMMAGFSIAASKIRCIEDAMQQYADQEKEKEAIAFDEWKLKNGYINNGNCWFQMSHKGDITSHTSEQLYQLFKNKIDKTIPMQELSNVIIFSEGEVKDIIKEAYIESGKPDGIGLYEFLKQKGL